MGGLVDKAKRDAKWSLFHKYFQKRRELIDKQHELAENEGMDQKDSEQNKAERLKLLEAEEDLLRGAIESDYIDEDDLRRKLDECEEKIKEIDDLIRGQH